MNILDTGTLVGSQDLQELSPEISKMVTEFLSVQAHYGGRNASIIENNALFEGEHWKSEAEDDTSYQLVLNYIRNVVLRFTAILARSPKLRVPSSGIPGSGSMTSAQRREKFLSAVWIRLMQSWGDVEIDASKHGWGVIQVIWDEQSGEARDVKVGEGADSQTRNMFTQPPFIIRAVDPEKFFPIFRSFNTPNDMLRVYRYDTNRLVEDIEDTYGVTLQPTGVGVIGVADTCNLIEMWTKKEYILLAETKIIKSEKIRGGRDERVTEVAGYTILSRGDNPMGCVPFFILQNIRKNPHKDPTTEGSMSDMEDLIGPNKHMDEMVSEVAEEIALNIHRPLVYQSDQHMTDPTKIRVRAGEVIPIASEEDLKPLDWNPTPEIVSKHLDNISQSIKDLSFLGDAGFGNIPTGANGIGFKIAMTPLEQIVNLKIPLRQDVLRGVCKLLLQTFENKAGDTRLKFWVKRQNEFETFEISAADISGAYDVVVDYGSILPSDEIADAQNEVYKYKTGVQSLYTTLDNLKVDDPSREIERIKAEASDPVLNPDKVIMISQAKQAGQQAGAPQPSQGAPTGAPPNPAQVPVGKKPPMPGTAQPTTSPVNPMGAGGMAGGMPGGGMMSSSLAGSMPPTGMPGPGKLGTGAGQVMLPPGMMTPMDSAATGGRTSPPIPEDEAEMGPGNLGPFIKK